MARDCILDGILSCLLCVDQEVGVVGNKRNHKNIECPCNTGPDP